MGIFYILTALVLITNFVIVKKSERKQNLISLCILGLIAYLAFNIFVCMIFGVLNITTNLWFLSIMNLIFTILFEIKIYKDKKIQSFEIRKRDFVGVIVSVIIVCYMAVSQYSPLSKTVANASVDACMHYSAATNFTDNMKILSKINNTTGYNFKTMQTGAYINTGIFMSVLKNIVPSLEDYVSFKLFEIGIMFLSVLAFYMLISDKLNSKQNYVIGIVFLILYSFAYPYTSLLYGFSYLSVSIVFATCLFYLAKLYGKNEVSFAFMLPLIVLMGIGIIFSYCLFVPALFSFICIYVFIADLKKEEKSYLKFFKKSIILITGILLIVTVLAILYLVIPTFTDSDQNRLTDAIGFDGGIYKALYQDFIFYIPFVAMFIYKTIKNKKINYQTVALIILGGQALLCFVGVIAGIVSAYYYYKIYYILWIVVVDIAVDIMCNINENKELKIALITYLAVWCLIIYGAVSGLEEKLQQKSPTLIEECRTQKIAGIYYDTNVFATKNINVSCIVDANRVKLAEAMGKVEGMTLKNMLVGGMNTNCKAWIYVISRIECGGQSINDLQYAIVETSVNDWMENKEKEYFVLFTGEKYETTDEYELIFQNEAGVILKKLHN